MPKTLTLDSSQIQTFGECPRRWELSYAENLTSSAPGVREDFAMGTYGHKLLEIYYSGIRDGLSISQSVEKALTFDHDRQTCRCGHRAENHGPLNIETQTLCVAGCECFSFEPIPFPLSQSKRDALRDRFNFYWMNYSRNDIAPQIVEKGFSYCLLDNSEYLFVLEGRIDLIGLLGGQQVFLDHKFQGRSHNLYSKSIQFRNYALVTETSLGIINYVRLHKEITKDTLQRQPINFSSLERQLWKDRLIEKFKSICDSIEEGPQLEESACSGKFGIPCEFTRICEESNPTVRAAIKENYYHIKESWKPW